MRHALFRPTRFMPRSAMRQLATIVAGLTFAGGVAAADSSAAAVLEPVHAFFTSMARFDQAGMRAQVLPAGTATLMREDKPVQLTLGDFVDHVKPGKQRIEERLGSPQVLVDENVAVVWAPYTFLLEGKPHHCGTDVFNLVRIQGQWRIAAIADNSRSCKA